jgi:hypothetical protein
MKERWTISEFTVVNIELDDQECLVKSLEEMGYKPEIHEEAKNLYGYHGDKRVQKAHVIVPRSQVGSASNDVGFEKNNNGKFTMHLSEYDRHVFKTDKLKQLYAKHRVNQFVKKNAGKYSHKTTKVDKDGTIRIRLTRFG